MAPRKPSIVRGLLAGAAAGLAATWVMDQFQELSRAGQKAAAKHHKLAEGESPWAVAHEQAQQEQESAKQQNSTEIVAQRVASAVGSAIPPGHEKQAGNTVHYTFGTLMGMAYAVTAELVPEVTAGGGTAFGTALFLGADEIAVPALQLAPPPNKTESTDHLQHWAAHVVYGGAVELVRSMVRRWL